MVKCGRHGWKFPFASHCPQCLFEGGDSRQANRASEGDPTQALNQAIRLIAATLWQTAVLRSVAEKVSYDYALQMAKGWQR